MNPELELILQYIMLVCLFFIVLTIVYIGERAIRQESQRKQVSELQEFIEAMHIVGIHEQEELQAHAHANNAYRDKLLCEEHDKYLEQVTESDMPIWMWDQSIPSINPNI